MTSLLFFVIALSANWVSSSSSDPFAILDMKNIMHETDPRFLSIALDAHIIEERWKNFNFSSRRTLNLAANLSPAYLRLGGTAADLVIFSEKSSKKNRVIFSEKNSKLYRKSIDRNDNECYCTTNKNETEKVCENLDALYAKGNFTLSGLDWMNINEFAKKAGLTFLFDFNVLLRNSDGSFNSENAKEILTFSSELGYNDIAWELGNEPNSLESQLGFNLTGYQLGKDFYRLKKLLTSFPLYENSTLVGPDIDNVENCLPGFQDPWPGNATLPCPALQYLEKVYLGSRGVMDALTWHHYYMDGKTATMKDFLNPKSLDDLVLQFEGVAQFLKERGWDQKDVWLGETASGFSGGTHRLSDRYASGLLWLNKLGLAAQHNYKVVIRQTFYHGCYALIGEDGFPNPDYWISALYKRIVSNRVLNVTTQNVQPTLKVYAHCTLKSDQLSGVTLFAVNMANSTLSFQLNPPLNSSTIKSFYFSALDEDLTNRKILLNGKLLQLTQDDDLPDFEPVVSPPSQTISIPAFGMAFWVFSDVNLDVCVN